MIKLKNLWKIALATMAMSTMLVACDTAKEDDDKGSKDDVVDTTVYVKYPTEAKVSDNGVYTAKLVKEGVSLDQWAAADGKEKIKVVLAPKAVVAKIIDKTIKTENDLFTDENKCYVYANNDVGNGTFTSTNVAEGTYVQPAGIEEKFVGLVITKDADGNYIVKFDINKINTNILLAKSSADSTIGKDGESNVDADTDVWNAVDKLKTDYIPMVLGSVTANIGPAKYPFSIWNAGVAIMKPSTDAYPTEKITEEVPGIPFTSADITSIVGEAIGWDHSEKLNDDLEYVFTAKGAGDTIAFTDGTWDYRFSDTVVDALDKEVKLTEHVGGDPAHVTFKDGVLEAGKKYTVSFIIVDDHNANIKVSAVK